MVAIGYTVSSGTFLATSQPGPGRVPAVSVTVERAMGTSGLCRVVIAGAIAAPLLPGDAIEVDLDGGRGPERVFSGRVDAVTRELDSTNIRAMDSLADLATIDTSAAYARVTADHIIRDVLTRAGLRAGAIEPGPELPSYVLHQGPRMLRHLRQLAELYGADLYTDGDGAVHCTTPTAERPAHHLVYGQHILAASLGQAVPLSDALAVFGEGAASQLGASRAHWLTTQLDHSQAQVGFDAARAIHPGQPGTRPRAFHSGALRSLSAVRRAAAGQAVARAMRLAGGHLDLAGDPSIRLADLVQVENLPRTPWPEGSEPPLLRVRALCHHISPARGFITRLEF